jgi:TRAP-type C4-dicarboxylate transport system permease small subunit
MISMALSAMSRAIGHRDRIGVEFMFARLPGAAWRMPVAAAFDLIGFAFFFALFRCGLTFAQQSFSQVSMICAIPKGWFSRPCRSPR